MRKPIFFLLLVSILWSCNSDSDHEIIISQGDGGDTTDTTLPLAVTTLYDQCAISGASDTLEVLTWNIERFPKANSTMDRVVELVTAWDGDLIALQEITSVASFNTLVSRLDGWEGVIASDGNMRLAYLYKSSEVTLLEHFEIFTDDWYAFPRPPLVIKVQYGSDRTAYLINLHLKCCGGTQNVDRRSDASERLKAYMDASLSTQEVILLGDFNDDILDIDGVSPFINFINDDQHYAFVDTEIAMGASSGWSYPSWPSHLDHIMVTNELFATAKTVLTIQADDCHASYESAVSDHLPVAVKIIKN